MTKFDFSKRDSFGSKIGVIAATAGSVIGLGNIWRFPYIAGENGGAAFLIVYLLFIALESLCYYRKLSLVEEDKEMLLVRSGS